MGWKSLWAPLLRPPLYICILAGVLGHHYYTNSLANTKWKYFLTREVSDYAISVIPLPGCCHRRAWIQADNHGLVKSRNKTRLQSFGCHKPLQNYWIFIESPPWSPNWLDNVYFVVFSHNTKVNVDHLPFYRWRSLCFEVCWWGSHGGVCSSSHPRSIQSCNISSFSSHSLCTGLRTTKDPAERTCFSFHKTASLWWLAPWPESLSMSLCTFPKSQKNTFNSHLVALLKEPIARHASICDPKSSWTCQPWWSLGQNFICDWTKQWFHTTVLAPKE